MSACFLILCSLLFTPSNAHIILLLYRVGKYVDNVAVSVDQFYTIRAVLISSIEEEVDDEEER